MLATWEQENNSPQPNQPKMEYIIQCSDHGEKLVSLQDIDSWKTLLRAVQIWNHAPTLEMENVINKGRIPPINYHRKQGRAHDYRGAGAQSQKRAVFFRPNNTICRLTRKIAFPAKIQCEC